MESGKLVYKQSGMLVNTIEGFKWIFVLSTSRSLYVGKKKKCVFQHSSFLSGGAITAAGRLVASQGVIEVHMVQCKHQDTNYFSLDCFFTLNASVLLQAIWPYSGHYLPTEDNFEEFISFLKEHNVDLTNVKVIKHSNSRNFLFSRLACALLN